MSCATSEVNVEKKKTTELAMATEFTILQEHLHQAEYCFSSIGGLTSRWC